jgi:translation initiation factor IF-1
MAKDDLVKISGSVTECLPNALFKVVLDNVETEILGTLSGRMRKNKIKILTGDRVDIEMSQYDLTKGRIIYRYK